MVHVLGGPVKTWTTSSVVALVSLVNFFKTWGESILFIKWVCLHSYERFRADERHPKMLRHRRRLLVAAFLVYTVFLFFLVLKFYLTFDVFSLLSTYVMGAECQRGMVVLLRCRFMERCL